MAMEFSYFVLYTHWVNVVLGYKLMIRYLLPLVLFAVLSVFLYLGLSLNPRDIGSTHLDKPAPVFELSQLLSPEKSLTQKEFFGKISLFNVWASWCTTCRYEHPLLMQLSAQTDIPIYGLNYKDTREEAIAVLQNAGNPYTASGFDEKGKVGIDWGVTGTPETFIIDKQGIVRYKHTGQLTVKLLQDQIIPLIQELEKS